MSVNADMHMVPKPKREQQQQTGCRRHKTRIRTPGRKLPVVVGNNCQALWDVLPDRKRNRPYVRVALAMLNTTNGESEKRIWKANPVSNAENLEVGRGAVNTTSAAGRKAGCLAPLPVATR